MSTSPSSGPRTVCVSNSASLRGSGLGARIDSFDEVVRFNNFETQGFEADVGTRTTIWVHSPLVPRRHHVDPPCRELLALPTPIAATHPPDPTVELLPLAVEEELLSRFSFKRGTWPTTGLLSLAYLLRSNETVYVCGWLPSRSAASFKKHYYRDRTIEISLRQFAYGMWRQFGGLVRGEGLQGWPHDLAAESLIYDTWRAQGRVSPLESQFSDPTT